jgi:hypothetical protein
MGARLGVKVPIEPLLEGIEREEQLHELEMGGSMEGEPVRGCGMEARSEPQHRTRVNSGAGRSVWVSVPRNVTPDIQSRQDGIRSGGGGKSCVLTLGDLSESTMSGSPCRDAWTTLWEKSDHPIRVMKPGNAGGAKGVTG